MTELFIFTYDSLYFPERTAATPRLRVGVARWLTAWQNGQIYGKTAVIWPCPAVGRRYALASSGVPISKIGHLPDEALAVANAERLKKALAVDHVYLSFNWHNYTDNRLPLGPGPIPKERANDPRWLPDSRPPLSGLALAALKGAAVTPSAALAICDNHNEKTAAFNAFVPAIYGPHFFLSWPKIYGHVERRRVTRRSLDGWDK